VRTGDRDVGEADARSSRTSWRDHRAVRPTIWVIVGLVSACALLLAYQATRTALALYRVKSEASALSGQVQRGDQSGARATLREIAHQAHVAHAHSDNVLWSAAGIIPWIGGDVDAVRVASETLDSASRKALPDALDVYDSVAGHKLRSKDGRFDTAAIGRLTPRFVTLTSDVVPADRRLDAIDADHLLLPPIQKATREFQTRLNSLVTLARSGAIASRILPGMLGAHGTRTYLLVEQNNAEIRATGGLPGAFSVLSTNDGKLTLGRQLSHSDFPVLTSPILPLTHEETALHNTQMGTDVRATNVTPDFPRAAQLIEAMYASKYGQHLDGIIFTDTVTLSAVMKATGPVKVGADTFTTDNVVAKLLHESYLRFPTWADDRAGALNKKRQDEYFSSAAHGIFDALSTRSVSPTAVVSAMAPMVDQRRFLVWSRRPQERAALKGTAIAGALPRGPQAAVRAGMYLNGATSAKMEYYLDYVGGVRSISCSDAGSQRFETRLRLKSNAPRDVSGLPMYVTGNGNYAPKGTMLDRLMIYGPVGGRIMRVEANGKKRPVFLFRDGDRPVAFLNLSLRPQGKISVTAEFQTARGHRGNPTLDWTPGIRTKASSVSASSACG
jgi:hypothetical protein